MPTPGVLGVLWARAAESRCGDAWFVVAGQAHTPALSSFGWII